MAKNGQIIVDTVKIIPYNERVRNLPSPEWFVTVLEACVKLGMTGQMKITPFSPRRILWCDFQNGKIETRYDRVMTVFRLLYMQNKSF